jgi:uncharacterized protein with FMN-binding domain
MSWRGVVASILTILALVLLLNFKTPAVTTALGQGQVVVGQPSAGASAGSKSSSGYSGAVTGPVVQTPFGNVQVKVTLQGGRIADVQGVQLPSGDGHSSQVSRYAAPRLRSAVLSAQSARVNTISGATYTSMAYLQSLQAALDKAR